MAELRFDTKKIKAGYSPLDNNLAISPPIYQTAAYDFKSTEHAQNLFTYKEAGYLYTRVGNPTVNYFAERVKALDGAKNVVAVGSGMAAISYTLLNLAVGGGTILASPYVYGGTIDAFDRLFPEFGVNIKLTDAILDPEKLDAEITDDVKAIYVESISNPNAYLLDIDAISEVAHKHGVPVVVDNTLATPYLYRPLEHGADIVVYSATKALTGHGNLIAGLILDNGDMSLYTKERYPQFYKPIVMLGGKSPADIFPDNFFIFRAILVYLNLLGAALSPQDAYLGIIGLETLSERVSKQSKNAAKIAAYLESSPAVEWVRHPSLASYKFKELADKHLTNGGGGVLSFGIKGTPEQEAEFLNNIKLFHYHVNLGDARSLIVDSPNTTHSELTEDEFKLAEIPRNLIRISAGLEDADDLIEDLEQAFKAAGLL
ncbi:O-acetylhomoserine aminocarboxypropyltransferase/cysteine synthase family protein [Ruminococcus albus]|uniref:homocysteine desulfhydrase n=1 Tax=Ruminococcus albus SY3 TaxID=1341156 RepID=A0A011UI93_RUMAL|nr:aminotransferase class I/II-fold pyridoxal phosphate-dependent enzyme [Ruminococcus albus]EXM40399.1 O-acetylhomoserine aminocarboxypropyltransferase [Ruminococcus albus SY3]MBE6869884.1 O-acetylhomoserine aminocarboxypropyltransferase/cysteine synthase [Ruminococcus albus]MBP5269078.1 O-acetylhomoserine aminocarboxypropyltransferase/cysteine synthase [Ruminococcus sp.]